jgi:hypothetical protein
MAREIKARHVSMALARYLINEVPAFAEASLAATSLELDGPNPSRAAENVAAISGDC